MSDHSRVVPFWKVVEREIGVGSLAVAEADAADIELDAIGSAVGTTGASAGDSGAFRGVASVASVSICRAEKVSGGREGRRVDELASCSRSGASISASPGSIELNLMGSSPASVIAGVVGEVVERTAGRERVDGARSPFRPLPLSVGLLLV